MITTLSSKHTIRVALAAVVALALFAGVAPGQTDRAQAAVSCVTIYRIYYNSPGTDDRSNTSLNGEWIRLHNGCSTGKSLTSWTIKDAAGHTYTFGSYTLKAISYVTIHTGKGTNTSTNRYWGSGAYIWNNDKDAAYLRNAVATLKDSCAYNNPSASAVYC
jgi:Lamin Tail Domain